MAFFSRDTGEGPVVVLIHGLGASCEIFDDVIALGGHRFISMDLPMSGRSARWAALDAAEIAVELSKRVEETGVERYRLFGHSYGGLVALQLAALHAERVEHLTVASSPALGLPLEARFLLNAPLVDWSLPFISSMTTSRALLRPYLSWLWGRRVELTDAIVDRYAQASAAHGFTAGMVEAMRSIGRYDLPRGALRKRDIQVLWGAHDPLVPLTQGEQLAAALECELKVLHDVGHCVPDEHPEAVHHAISRAPRVPASSGLAGDSGVQDPP